MKSLLVLFFIVCFIYTINVVSDKLGFSNEDPAEIATETAQQLSKSLAQTSTEQEVISLFSDKSFRYIPDAENAFAESKKILERAGSVGETEFENANNKLEVLKSRVTVTLDKFREIQLSDETARQEIENLLQTELSFANDLQETIQAQRNGGNWQEPYAKTKALRESLKLSALPEKLSELDKKNTLLGQVKFLHELVDSTKEDIRTIWATQSDQLNSAETPSEAVLGYDLQTLQILKNRLAMILDKVDATDFQDDNAKQKITEAFELETALADTLSAAVDAKLYGEDHQPALNQVKPLYKSVSDAGNQLRDLERDIESVNKPPEPVKEPVEQSAETVVKNDTPAEIPRDDAPTATLNDEDKAVVKAYLEKKQPLLAADFGREVCGLSTPLVRNEPTEQMEKYIDLMASGVDYSAPTNPALAKAVAACNNYFGAEALIANYYYNLKKENHADGLLDNVANVLDKASMIGDAGKVEEFYSEQRKAESEIKQLAAWSGAELFDSYTEAKVKLTGTAVRDILFK